MKKALLFLLLHLTAPLAQGQDSTLVYNHPARFVVKLAPLSLLDPDATIQAGLEYRTGQRTSVQGELGYGGRNLSLLDNELRTFAAAEVWRGRAEVRFYTGRYRTNAKKGIAIRSHAPLGNYWAIEGLFKQINGQKAAQLGRIDINPPVPIELTGPQLIRRYVVGAHVKFGRQFAFYDPQRRLFSRTLLDIYWGLGARLITNQGTTPTTDESCGCGVGRSFARRGTAIAPSVSLGLKLGFAL
jgi:hypothetical protein